MKRFIVLYHASVDAMKQSENSSPEEMKKGMEAWMTWAKNCGDQLVDMGNPLMGGQKVLAGGSKENSSREVCGFSILQAKDMDGALALLEGHPHLGWNEGCEIEVHESMPLPG